MQGAPSGGRLMLSVCVCGRLPTSCNVNNEPFIHPAAVTWASTARGWQIHRAGHYCPQGAPLTPVQWWGRRDTWRSGWRGGLMEPCAEMCCQYAKGASSREIAWAGGPGLREGDRRPGGCWVRRAAKDLGDGAWDLKQGVLLREGIVLSFLLSHLGPCKHPPP